MSSRLRNRYKAKWIRITGVGVAIVVVLALVFATHQNQVLGQEASRLQKILNLQSNSKVAEIGAGDGSFMVQIAKKIDSSSAIYATELSPQQLDQIRQKAETLDLKNVKVIQGAVDSTRLPAECCDVIFMRHVYHHFSQPEQMNASLLSSLQPGGQLAVIDFPPDWLLSFWKVEGAPKNREGHGVRKETIANELTQAGFEVVRMIDDWEGKNFLVLGRKPK
jgi:ubiquinone/menaquinone biosynthesis C-methylase UbiE